jgi:HSP20 family protein
MSTLIPRDSFFQDLFDFRRDFDQIFNRLVSGNPWWSEDGTTSAATFGPAVESYVDKDGKTFHVSMALPGVEPKDVQIHAQGNTLTISGERKVARGEKDVDWLHKELWYGKFERMLTLPEGVDVNKLYAEYRNGLLEITAPVAASALPRRIEIKTTPMAKQMNA